MSARPNQLAMITGDDVRVATVGHGAFSQWRVHSLRDSRAIIALPEGYLVASRTALMHLNPDLEVRTIYRGRVEAMAVAGECVWISDSLRVIRLETHNRALRPSEAIHLPGVCSLWALGSSVYALARSALWRLKEGKAEPLPYAANRMFPHYSGGLAVEHGERLVVLDEEGKAVQWGRARSWLESVIDYPTGAIQVIAERGELRWFERCVTEVDGPALRRKTDARGGRH